MSYAAANPRLLAWQVLAEWGPDSAWAEELIDRAARQHSLSTPNRGLLNAIVLAVLRHRTLLDAWIDRLRDGGKLDADVRRWLQTGLAQCLLLGMPEHAAVNETVALAGRARGLVNAILRRALREREALETFRRKAAPAVRHSLPEFLLHRWSDLHGDDAVEALGEWCNTPAPVIVRANALRPHSEKQLTALPGATPLPEHPGFYVCEDTPRNLLASGHCYAQDPSTSLAPLLLAPESGHAVLDACAAPGGKSGLMAQLMANSGHLIATDSAPRRMERLRGNLQRLDVKIAECTVHDWERQPAPPASWAQRFPDGFDRILADVPCSNTGVLRRRVDVRWRLQPEFLHGIVHRQRTLLANLLPLLRIGGRLVYSTCSIEPEENAAIVRRVLSELPGYEQLQTRTALPHLHGIDGAFCSLIERKA